MGEIWETFDLVEQEFLATGETAVVLSQVKARVRATGRSSASRSCKRSRSRKGRITEVRPFYWDTQAIAHACTTTAD
ncbi:hypothetical protein [Kribbella flavida]|uniref:hypothetical protein n=1 Tax=Kribbella flavida TaxID=182640 RepID=UPI00019BDFAA|nr:hypothetical protein [Kribbella flavida]